MAVVMSSQPSVCGSRPQYLDDLFRSQPTPRLPPISPSVRSTNSSISFASSSPFEYRPTQPIPRPLSPAVEEDQTDRTSVRSLRLNLSPRTKLKSMWNRRTYPQIKEASDNEDTEQPRPRLVPRRPSLPKLYTSFTTQQSHGKSHRRQSKPLPAPPRHEPEGLSSQKCYYFCARNCNGYVLGGAHGDACEGCAQAGFFGAP